MSRKHWTFIILSIVKKSQHIERMKWEFISEVECIVEFVKLCKHLVLERTIDPKIHQTTAIYLRYSQQLLLKKEESNKTSWHREKERICNLKTMWHTLQRVWGR